MSHGISGFDEPENFSQNFFMNTVVLTIEFGNKGNGKLSFPCGVGLFDGKNYVQDDRIENGLWITRDGVELWILPIQGLRRQCRFCGMYDSVNQKNCTECGALLWDKNVKTDMYFLPSFINNVGVQVEKTSTCFGVLNDIREMILDVGMDSVRDEHLAHTEFRIVPKENRRFDPENGHYIAVPDSFED